eukprot:NODE_3429_length_669_cov_86.666129_g2442_i0.p3 GENE.NODE_3429_length_669_cov_86.666129_g2442_i0~~NODE_3429_length_669_cov_86.666129_g2442_i0.p3  ORF type:complete len:51 (+),score=31.53 NODE_3429_length_669_cov_86.666129_g2442_i0:32-154(+)
MGGEALAKSTGTIFLTPGQEVKNLLANPAIVQRDRPRHQE